MAAGSKTIIFLGDENFLRALSTLSIPTLMPGIGFPLFTNRWGVGHGLFGGAVRKKHACENSGKKEIRAILLIILFL